MAPLKVLIMAVSTLSRAVRVLSPRAWQITLRTETVTALTSMPLHVKKLVDKVFKRSRKRDDAGSETSDSSTLYLPVHNSPLNETIVALRRGNDALIHHPELKQSVSGLLLLTENIDDKVDPSVLEKLGGELKQLLGILQAPELSNTPSVQGYARNLASHVDAAIQQARSRISGSSTGQSNGQLRDVAAITALADSLHSAIEKYCGQITTQDSTATSSTTKKKARDFSGQVAGALTIVKESLDGVPVIGLKAAIGGLLEILKAVNQLIDNDDDLMKLIDHLQRLVKIVSLPPEDDAQLIDGSSRERINELTEDILHITAEAEKLKTQNTGGKFFGSADNASAIKGLMRAVDQATERFQIAGGLRLEKGVARVEKGVQELQVGSGRIESGIGRLEGGVGSVGEGVGRVEGGIGMVKEGVQRVDKKIEQLEANIMSAADEAMLNNIQPRSDNARYNSASQTSASFCLPDTRVAILTEISRWLENPEALPVYWLYGMAGTGKSTIARTVAKYSDERGSYGASFFFSRDEDDRRNATRVFPTLAHQLACYNPSFRPHITAAIRINPGASTAMMRTQLDKLIVEPLQLSPPYSSPVLIVLDALDECASELHIVEMLNLLAPAIQAIRKTSNVKFFITCRPEVHIHSVLTKPEMQAVADVSVLHDIEKSVVQEDIRLFVEHHLTRIAENMLPKGTTWPPEDEKDALVEMSDVLFIFASVSIAYIGDPKFRQPKLRLRNLVSSWVRELGSPPLKRLDLLYRQILTAALPEDDEEEREEVAQRIHQILGVIVLLQNPLSVRSLDLLLQKESDTVASTIGPFNSVLSIPLDDQRPVRVFHKSFPDFLTDSKRSGKEWYHVDSKLHHGYLAKLCLTHMNIFLRRDLCGVGDAFNEDIEDREMMLAARIPPHVMYACEHWGAHLREAEHTEELEDVVDVFCRAKLIYWLEVLSIAGKVNLAISLLNLAQDWCKNSRSQSVLYDCYRFVLYFQDAITLGASQIYKSALPFIPPSRLLSLWERELGQSVRVVCGREAEWDTALFRLKGHTKAVFDVAFSPNGSQIVSGSQDGTVNVWDARTGVILKILKGHTASVTAVRFSSYGNRIASSSRDKTIGVWDARAGSLLTTLKGHTLPVTSVAFSPDDTQLISGSGDKTIRIWDITDVRRATTINILEGHLGLVSSISFSPDGIQIISGSSDKVVNIWDNKTGVLLHSLKKHTGQVTSVAFLPDGSHAVSGSSDDPVLLWNTKTGDLVRTFTGHSKTITSLAVAPDGSRVTGSSFKTIFVWDVNSGSMLEEFRGHSERIAAVAFSPDGTQIASGSLDKTVAIFDKRIGVRSARNSPVGHSDIIECIAISFDGSRIVSGSFDKTVITWDTKSGDPLYKLEDHTEPLNSVVFSLDGTRFASASSDTTAKIWDVKTGTLITDFRGHTKSVHSVIFSPDGTQAASGGSDHTVILWDAKTGDIIHTLKEHSGMVTSVAFSPDGKYIASVSSDRAVVIWNAKDGTLLRSLSGHTEQIASVAFSPDNIHVVSGGRDKKVMIWNTITGALIRDLEGHLKDITSVTFTNYGSCVISKDSENTLLWTDLGSGLHHRDVPSSLAEEQNVRLLYSKKWIISRKQGAGQKICFLIQHDITEFDSYGHIFVFGTRSGNIHILDFSPCINI